MDKNLKTALVVSSVLSLFMSAAAIQIATRDRSIEDTKRLDRVSRLANNVKLLDELLQDHEQRLNELQGKPSIAPTPSKEIDVEARP